MRAAMQAWRLRCGLLWRGAFPPVAWREIGLMAVVFLLWALAMTLDYADQARSEADAQTARAERMAATVADCLNGRAVFSYPDPAPLKNGYGKVAVLCRTAEEVRL